VYERVWFTETTEIAFEDMIVPISAHYDALLTKLYGDYMQIPSEEDRKIKEHAILIDTERNYTEYEHYRDGMVWDVHTRNIH
jgi:lipopolysaccharide cholinephosphotransferase